ncbi:hypothetical protein CYMTET_6031 [Cymbomonas tetramitiformis]|uniref:rRNA methylase n=1 Tax=Cymbomonas tetramitiformis TaxID=36881 RepID=A0AAE0LIU2_9CHLO|nr:hypothetical protein CYMTET_6031 [Cymbomonas tetramitiformis]
MRSSPFLSFKQFVSTEHRNYIASGVRLVRAVHLRRPQVGLLDTGCLQRVARRSNLVAPIAATSEGVEPFVEFVMGSARVTTVAHRMWERIVQPGDTVVDGTCGNGSDTVALAKAAMSPDGKYGRVVGFDIQSEAIASTQSALETALTPAQMQRVELIHGCHSAISDYVGPLEARLICFNLGYLPGGDHSLITQPQTSLDAVKASMEVLMPDGLISIVAYTRHEGGQEEYDNICDLAETLSPKVWTVTTQGVMNRRKSPIMIHLHKKPLARSRQATAMYREG